jgi:hypothetical protein
MITAGICDQQNGELGVGLHSSNPDPVMSASGHSLPGRASSKSDHVRYAPKATVGHQNAIDRDGTKNCH